ncbi:hypothetical protein T11_7184 [Trichinella zimbabwensis]|uniref:Uncharacterized protein n=1 Tax=Trichinella zimbabwensis TaxID=268475 RepID=A0A0V1I5B8_9BILA|nr:hypothetical protein T11_7184 [Trichinella zimbabwensis]
MNSALFLMSLLYYFYSTTLYKRVVICRYMEEFKYKDIQLKFNFGRFGAAIFEFLLSAFRSSGNSCAALTSELAASPSMGML